MGRENYSTDKVSMVAALPAGTAQPRKSLTDRACRPAPQHLMNFKEMLFVGSKLLRCLPLKEPQPFFNQFILKPWKITVIPSYFS